MKKKRTNERTNLTQKKIDTTPPGRIKKIERTTRTDRPDVPDGRPIFGDARRRERKKVKGRKRTGEKKRKNVKIVARKGLPGWGREEISI